MIYFIRWTSIFILSIIFSTLSHANTKPTFIAEYPIEFTQGEPSTFINIGNKDVPLMLDTGAAKGSLILSQAVLKDIHVKYTGETHCMKTVDGSYCMKKFTIPIVKVGELTLHDVPGEEMRKLWGSGKGFVETAASRNGVIGLSFLRQFNVLVDYKSRKITYLAHQTYPKNIDFGECHLVKTDFVYGISGDYSFNHRVNRMILDTGSNLSLIKPGLAKNLESCDSSHRDDFKECHVDKIALFSDQKAEIFYEEDLPMPFDGIIGSAYLEHHLVFMDAYNGLVYFC